MNIYARTFSVLKAYWKQLVIASTSAALHAAFAGMLIWMIGPLMSTLFQMDSPLNGIAPQTTQSTPVAPADSTSTFGNAVTTTVTSWVGSIKASMKGWVDYFVSADSRQEMLMHFCLLILVVVLIKNTFLYIQGFFMSFVQQSVIRDFRNRLFEKYQRLPIDYFHERRTGHVMSRVTNDVVVLNESIDIGFNRLITDSLQVLILFTFLIILSWKLTALALVILPAFFGFIYFVGKKLRKYSARSQERMADVNSVLEESIANMRIVKAFSMEPFQISRFLGATQRYFQSLLRMSRIRHLATPINDTLATMAGLIILFFAGGKIIAGQGELTAGDFFTFVLAMFSMIAPVKSLSQIHIKLQEGIAAAERIFEVVDAQETIADPVHPVALNHFADAVLFDHVSFSYNPSEPVLKDINFEIRRGEVIAVVGPSGAGKSTLLDLLPRFYDPKEGRILVDGHDIRTVSLASLRGLMGIVTQEVYLFNDTIYNNIAFGMEGVTPNKVEDAACAANAHGFISEFAAGYHSMVGNRGVMLSGGQRQRLAIARALLRNPQILIFDEATSALDTESEMLVQEAIDRLMTNRTSLVVAHRLSTVKHADKILVIDRGQIVEFGTHDELMSRAGLYRKLYSMQFRDAV